MATQAYAYNPDPSPYAPPANAPPEGTYAVPMTQYPPQQQYPPGTVIPQQQYPPGTVIYAAAPAPVVMNPVTGPDPSNIPDYMATSVINLLCCCFILGLLALLKSNEVQQAKARRDYNAAMSASTSAKQLNTVGIVIGLLAWLSGVVAIILYVIFIVWVLSY